jgi:hypothetical protein
VHKYSLGVRRQAPRVSPARRRHTTCHLMEGEDNYGNWRRGSAHPLPLEFSR